MAVARTIVGNCPQSAADVQTSIEIVTNLRDQNDTVLRVLRVEMDFEPTVLYTWPGATDCMLSANLANDAGIYGGVVNKVVVCRNSIVQAGTAASTTDRMLQVQPFIWEPIGTSEVYLYNERCFVNLLSIATGVVNVVGVRITVVEVGVGSFAKTAMKA